VERREHKRYYASLEIEIKEVGSSFPTRGTTTDVSLSGCYVATIFPMAVGARINFTMRVDGEKIKGRGSVQTCHPGVGMGISFTDLTNQDKLRLDGYLRARRHIDKSQMV
jgi:PilZ domain